MRVCLVIQKLAGLGGGAERVLADVATGLARRGVEVSVLTYEARADAPYYPMPQVTRKNLFALARSSGASSAKNGGGRMERLIKSVPDIWPLPQAKWALTYAPFIRALTREFHATRPAVVIGFMPTGIMSAAIAAAPLGIPVIGSTHNVPEEDYGDGPRWDHNPIYRRRRLEALNRCAAITVLQPEFRSGFAPHLQDRLRVMPNAVTQANPPPNGPREPLILGVGRLTEVKRFDRLIEAFAPLASRFPDWRVEIYGKGPEEAALQAKIAAEGLGGQIRLMGQSPDIFDVYRRAAILAHPARFEGFGLVVGEALSHGLPVVAYANCPGVNQLVEHGRTGLLAESDTAGFAAALETLMNQPDQRLRMGAAGPQSMKAYDPACIIDHWQSLIADHCLSRTEPI